MSKLIKAVIDNDLNKVKSLLENEYSKKNSLFDRKSDINETFYGSTALHHAIEGKKIDIAKELLRAGAKIDIGDRHGDTVLHVAAEKCFEEIIQFLLETNTDLNVNLTNNWGFTPLHYAASRGFVYQETKTDQKIIKLLLMAGAKINLVDKKGRTALHVASEYKLEIVTLLIENGAEINLADKQGDTPLHIAAARGRGEVVKKLISLGAKVNLVNKAGRTPLSCFASRCSEENFDAFQLLVQRSSNINLADIEGKTALHYVVEWNFWKATQLLIQTGAKVTSINKEGKLPLHYAAERPSKANIQMLLQAMEGCSSSITSQVLFERNVNLPDKKGMTPLHYAASHAWVEVIQALLQAGAKVDLVNNAGETPFYYVVAHTVSLNHGEDLAEIAKLLIINGADANKGKKSIFGEAKPLEIAMKRNSNQSKYIINLLNTYNNAPQATLLQWKQEFIEKTSIGVEFLPPWKHTDKEKYDYWFKMTVIGYHASGKTSCISRFTNQPEPFDTTPTVGASFGRTEIQIDSKKIRLDIWDTPGIAFRKSGEINPYHSLIPIYYRSAAIVLILIDVTVPFEITQKYLNACINEESNCPRPLSSIPRILVGGKIDSVERKISFEEGIKLQEQVGAITYLECSAKTGENVKAIFETAAKIVFNKIEKIPFKIDKPDINQIEKSETTSVTTENALDLRDRSIDLAENIKKSREQFSTSIHKTDALDAKPPKNSEINSVTTKSEFDPSTVEYHTNQLSELQKISDSTYDEIKLAQLQNQQKDLLDSIITEQNKLKRQAENFKQSDVSDSQDLRKTLQKIQKSLAPLEANYQKKQEILKTIENFKKHPNLKSHYRKLKIRLEEIVFGCKSVASELPKVNAAGALTKVATGMELAHKIVATEKVAAEIAKIAPLIGTALGAILSGLATGTEKISEVRFTNMLKAISNLGDFKDFGKASETTARILTLQYENQLTEIFTAQEEKALSEKRRTESSLGNLKETGKKVFREGKAFLLKIQEESSAEIIADFAVLQIFSNLLEGLIKPDIDLTEQFIHAVVTKPNKLETFKQIILNAVGINELNTHYDTSTSWKLHEFYYKPGIVTIEKEYYAGDYTDYNTYSFRKDTSEDAKKLGFKKISPRLIPQIEKTSKREEEPLQIESRSILTYQQIQIELNETQNTIPSNNNIDELHKRVENTEDVHLKHTEEIRQLKENLKKQEQIIKKLMAQLPPSDVPITNGSQIQVYGQALNSSLFNNIDISNPIYIMRQIEEMNTHLQLLSHAVAEHSEILQNSSSLKPDTNLKNDDQQHIKLLDTNFSPTR